MNNNNEIIELFDKTIQHWNRMINWAKKQNLDDSYSPFLMISNISESPIVNDCPLCKKYLINNYMFDCKLCPLFQKTNTCGTYPNLYPKSPAGIKYSEWIEKSLKFVDQLQEIRNMYIEKKSINWNKPVQFKNSKYNKIESIQDCKIVSTKMNDYIIHLDGTSFSNDNNEVIIENIPDEEMYDPVSVGDTLLLNENSYIIASWGVNKIGLTNIKIGTRWNHEGIEVKDCYKISFSEFKKLTSDYWLDAYKTLIRNKEKL